MSATLSNIICRVIIKWYYASQLICIGRANHAQPFLFVVSVYTGSSIRVWSQFHPKTEWRIFMSIDRAYVIHMLEGYRELARQAAQYAFEIQN